MSSTVPLLLSRLPDDVVWEILGHLNTNRDMVAVHSTCKSLHYLTGKRGYIRHLHFSWGSNAMNFVMLHGKHEKSLDSLQVSRVVDPIPWIPCRWPRQITFSSCVFSSTPIDPPLSPTEVLSVICWSGKATLRINWAKLPALRVLNLHVYNVELTGLHRCRNLEKICLNLGAPHNVLPEWVAKLKKLRLVASNFGPGDVSLHFTSPRLTVCLVPKTKPFTSESKLVPPRHLADNIPCNLTLLSHIDLEEVRWVNADRGATCWGS